MATENIDVAPMEVSAPQLSPLELLRSKVLATRPRKSKQIEFFGATIELRQPLMSEVINRTQHAGDEGAARSGLIAQLIEHAYLPGTDLKVFSVADQDAIEALPAGRDFGRVADTMAELMEVNLPEVKPA